MIKVVVNNFILDLSSIGIRLIEKNNKFRDKQTKSFSYPFPLKLTKNVAIALGIPDVNNISDYPTKINVVIIEGSSYYDGYLKISKIVGITANTTLFYGVETLAVFDMDLNTLPFEIIDTGDVKLFAKNQNSKFWPNATHNFVTIKDEEFHKKTNYEHFEGYLNNTDAGNFISNENIVVDEELVAGNKNVLMPMPYLMEILKVGFALENKVIKGDFVDDVFNHKIVIVPDNFIEQFSTSHLETSNFDLPTLNYVSNQIIYSNYEKVYTANFSGSYSLYLKLDLPADIAEYFMLKVKHGNKVLLELSSENTAVNISENLTINPEPGVTEKVTVSLTLKEQTASISNLNFLKFEYQESKLNVFSNKFSLADFMPKITFREFSNIIQNLFNVDFNISENVVYINYIDPSLSEIIYDDHSKYEIPKPIREVDKEKVFSLKLDNESCIYVGANGVIPSTNAENESSLTTIEIPVIPLKMAGDNGKPTVLNTSISTKLRLALYDGLVNDEPLAIETFNNRSLNINDIYLKYKNWLHFRTNSEIIEDSFIASSTEIFNVKKGLIKYNKKHLIKEIQKKSINKNFNKVTMKFESL